MSTVPERRPLGATGLTVSSVILGCGNFGGAGSERSLWGTGTDRDEAFRLMDAAVDLGVTCLDTADAYGGGLSERFVGEWLAGRPGHVRERLLIATKVGQPVGDGPGDRGLHPSRIPRQVESSLRRLGVDTIDLYLTHHPDPAVPWADTLGALGEMVAAGKIRHVGACNMTAADLRAAAPAGGPPPFGWVQNACNLLQHAEQAGVLDVVGRHGLGYTPHSPLAGGWLTGKYTDVEHYPPGSRMATRPQRYEAFVDPTLPARIAALRTHAEQRGCSLPALALAWLLGSRQVTACLVGPRRPGHLEVVSEALGLDIDDDERALLEELAAGP